MSSAKASGHKSRIARSDVIGYFVAALVVAPVSVISCSLTISFIKRTDGSFGWTELAHIGDYWAGHLGALALPFLALTLYLESRALRTERWRIDRDYYDRHLRSLVDQLRSSAQSLEAISIRLYSDLAPASRHCIVGLQNLMECFPTEQESIRGDDLIFDRRRLREHMRLYRQAMATSRHLKKLASQESTPEEPTYPELLTTLPETHCPEQLQRRYAELEQEEGASIERIRRLGMNEQLTEKIVELITRGWDVELTSDPEKSEYVAACVREELNATVRRKTGVLESPAAAFTQLLDLLAASQPSTLVPSPPRPDDPSPVPGREPAPTTTSEASA